MAKTRSLDDVMEDQRKGKLAYRVGNHPLPEDNDRPAEVSDNPHDTVLPDDHPVADTDTNTTELYQEGWAGIAETPEPETHSSETDIDPLTPRS